MKFMEHEKQTRPDSNIINVQQILVDQPWENHSPISWCELQSVRKQVHTV